MASPASTGQTPPWRDAEPFAVTAQGQHLVFYPAGKDRLACLLRLIDEAKSTLDLAFYIYRPDRAGSLVRQALVAAARRGVAVSLIVDGFGGEVDQAYFAELVAAGGHFRLFSPRWGLRYLIRNHQKIVLADGRIAMLGGFNVADSYFAPPDEGGWHDLGFTVEGSLVADVARWYGELDRWTASPKAQFRTIRRLVREWRGGSDPARLLIGGPTRWLSPWARAVTRDLIHGHRLDMLMAYFSPAALLLRRIRRIAAKGETRLVFAGKTDNGATIGAARLLYRRLLNGGARVWEFQPAKLHSKLIVLDDAVYLGSANFDMRSLYINLEIVLKIEDKALAERMRAYIASHQPASLEVTPELYRQWATPWARLRWWACWFLVAVVDYTVTRRLNLGL